MKILEGVDLRTYGIEYVWQLRRPPDALPWPKMLGWVQPTPGELISIPLTSALVTELEDGGWALMDLICTDRAPGEARHTHRFALNLLADTALPGPGAE